MNIFIVHGHHESKSFNGAMTRVAVETLEKDGHNPRPTLASAFVTLGRPSPFGIHHSMDLTNRFS